MAPLENQVNSPENKIENNVNVQEESNEKVNDQVNSGLEAIDTDIVKNYLSTKMIGKEFSKASDQEKQGLDDISEAIFKRIKKTQRVPLDITINSWITSVMSLVQSFSGSSSSVPKESEDKISQITNTVGAFDKIRDQFEDKIAKAMSQFQVLSSGGNVMTELENAFTSLEQKVTVLKENRNVLKEKAKANNMSIKAYYQSQTRLYANEFIAQLKGGPTNSVNNAQEKKDNKDNTIVPPVVNVDTSSEKKDDTSPEVTNFLDEVYKLEGTKYVRGGDDEGGIDCSGLIIEGWKKTGIVDNTFDTTAAGIYQNYVQKLPDNKDIKKGDLLFYQNKNSTKLYKKGQISHVMIALGPVTDGKIRVFDASVSKGVRERVIDVSGGAKYSLLAGRPNSAYDAIASGKKLTKESSENLV